MKPLICVFALPFVELPNHQDRGSLQRPEGRGGQGGQEQKEGHRGSQGHAEQVLPPGGLRPGFCRLFRQVWRRLRPDKIQEADGSPVPPSQEIGPVYRVDRPEQRHEN